MDCNGHSAYVPRPANVTFTGIDFTRCTIDVEGGAIGTFLLIRTPHCTHPTLDERVLLIQILLTKAVFVSCVFHNCASLQCLGVQGTAQVRGCIFRDFVFPGGESRAIYLAGSTASATVQDSIVFNVSTAFSTNAQTSIEVPPFALLSYTESPPTVSPLSQAHLLSPIVHSTRQPCRSIPFVFAETHILLTRKLFNFSFSPDVEYGAYGAFYAGGRVYAYRLCIPPSFRFWTNTQDEVRLDCLQYDNSTEVTRVFACTSMCQTCNSSGNVPYSPNFNSTCGRGLNASCGVPCDEFGQLPTWSIPTQPQLTLERSTEPHNSVSSPVDASIVPSMAATGVSLNVEYFFPQFSFTLVEIDNRSICFRPDP